MAHNILPKRSVLRSFPSPLKWLAKKLDPFDEDDVPAEFGGDEAEREHEASELARTIKENMEREQRERQRVDMSKVIVPILPHEVPPSPAPHRPPSPIYKPKLKPKVQTTSNRPTQTPKPEPETTPPQQRDQEVDSDSFVITGSALLPYFKTELFPHERERVARELKEAMECDFFKMWPTYEDPRPESKRMMDKRREARFKAKSKGKEIGKRMDRERKDARKLARESEEEWKARMTASNAFVKKMDGDEKEERDRIEREWKARGERPTEGRRRVKGGFGYESVVEKEALMGTSEWGFMSTLAGVVEERMEEKGGESKRMSMRREDTRDVRGMRKCEKSMLSAGSSTSTSELATDENLPTARDHRERQSSNLTKGKEKKAEETSRPKEDHRTSSQSQSKSKQISNTSGNNIPKPKARYRPWAKDSGSKDNSEDEYPFTLNARKDKRT
jgi:hypothetical protein